MRRISRMVWAGVVAVIGGVVGGFAFSFGSDLYDATKNWVLAQSIPLTIPQTAFILAIVSGSIMIAYGVRREGTQPQPPKRTFNWRDNVRCRNCGRLFDFQHRPDKVRLNEALDAVTVACPYCEHEDTYPEKDWIENTYDVKSRRNLESVAPKQPISTASVAASPTVTREIEEEFIHCEKCGGGLQGQLPPTSTERRSDGRPGFFGAEC
jgi:transcription elongation factor Elf1